MKHLPIILEAIFVVVVSLGLLSVQLTTAFGMVLAVALLIVMAIACVAYPLMGALIDRTQAEIKGAIGDDIEFKLGFSELDATAQGNFQTILNYKDNLGLSGLFFLPIRFSFILSLFFMGWTYLPILLSIGQVIMLGLWFKFRPKALEVIKTILTIVDVDK